MKDFGANGPLDCTRRAGQKPGCRAEALPHFKSAVLILLMPFLLAGQVLAPYVPTPEAMVDKLLDAGQLKAGEHMFDLGSGDGRIVIEAARKYGAFAVGVELDETLAANSAAKIRQLGLEKTARIIHGDVLTQDYSSADLVTIYLFPEANAKIRPILDLQLKKGTRIVSHEFEIPGWRPQKTITVADDGTGRSRTIFVYIK